MALKHFASKEPNLSKTFSKWMSNLKTDDLMRRFYAYLDWHVNIPRMRHGKQLKRWNPNRRRMLSTCQLLARWKERLASKNRNHWIAGNIRHGAVASRVCQEIWTKKLVLSPETYTKNLFYMKDRFPIDCYKCQRLHSLWEFLFRFSYFQPW